MDPITGYLVQLIVGIVLSAAANLLQQAFAADKKGGGTRGQAQLGGKVPQYFLIGTVAEAGKREYRNAWGTADGVPNAYLVDVYSFGDLPITAMTRVFINGTAEPVATTGKVTQGFPTTGDKAGNFWVEFFTGAQTVANSYLTGKFGSDADRPWLADMIGRGVPYLTATALWDQEKWTGFPTVVGEFQGIKLYDPRKDVSRGGTHQWAGAIPTPAEQATWSFSDNNAVMIYNIERGIYYQGEHVWGGKKSAAELPYAVWAAAMDKCDLAINLVGGGTEKQFRAGRRVDLNERPADVIKELLIGANARISHAADGTVYILVGVPSVADGSFTDDDVLATEPIGSIPFPNLDEIVNGATATYREPSQAWEDKETAPYYRSDLEALDDGRRQVEGLDLGTTFSGTQAQRVIKAVVEEGRRFKRHVVALPPEFAQYRPLQVLAWTNAKLGYNGKLFLITARTVSPWGQVVFGLQEIDPADHQWVPANDERPLTFAPVVINRPHAQEVSGFYVEPAIGADAQGNSRRGGYTAHWSVASVATDVDFVRISHRLQAETEVRWTGVIPRPNLLTGSANVFEALLPGDEFEVQIEYLAGSGRATVASDWLTVVIPDIRLGAADLATEINDFIGDTGTALLEQAQDIADNAQAILDEQAARNEAILAEAVERIVGAQDNATRIRNMVEELTETAFAATEQDFGNFLDKQQIRTELRTGDAEVTAAYLDAITVAVGPGSAVANRLEALQVEVDTAEAAIVTEQTARADGDSAQASLTNTLAAQLRGDHTGTDLSLVTAGLIYQERQARVTQDEALATSITLLSAGAGEQFDPAKIWFFDTSIEGWTGNGAPTAPTGFLRPASHATDPYVESPIGIAAPGAQYSQVRMRIRKVGNPAWEGYLWWRAAADATWDAARRVSFAQPSYDVNNIGLVTINPAWAVTIDRIRVDLAAASDASNYFEIDWLSVGRPSPSASNAALATEAAARASADSAEVTARQTLSATLTGVNSPTGLTIADLSSGLLFEERSARTTADQAQVATSTALAAQLSTAEGNIAGTATAVSAIDARVTAAEGTLSTVVTDVDAVEAALPGKASQSALSALEAQVLANEVGTSISGTYAQSLRSALSESAFLASQQDLVNHQDRVDANAAVAVAQQLFNTQINDTNTSLSIVAGALTEVQALLPGLASGAAVSALDSRVTATEAGVSSLSSALTTTNAEVAGKASASGLSALESRVTGTETTNTAQATQISGVQTSLGTKASASALSALDTQVQEIDGDVSAQATLITALQAAAGDATANLNVKWEVVPGPTGYVRYAILGRVGAAGAYRTAVGYLDVPSNPALPTRWVFDSQGFFLIDTSSGTMKVPFSVEDGVINLTGQVRVNGALLDPLSVNTPAIANDAITRVEFWNGVTTGVPNDGGWATVLDENCVTMGGELILLVSGTMSKGGDTAAETYTRILIDNQVRATWQTNASPQNGSMNTQRRFKDIGTGTRNLKIQVGGSAFGGGPGGFPPDPIRYANAVTLLAMNRLK